jgi:hypothetical protein
MATESQIQANRSNAARSTGPRTDAGKARVRLNALKHGFRAADLILPTEDTAQFDAFRQAWHDDWKPCTQARFQLVEQLVADAWRLRRCVRVETLRLRGRAQAAIKAHEDEVETRLAKACQLLDTIDPNKALKLLDYDRPGVEAQLAMWEDLAGSATSVEHWWDTKNQHERLLTLLGIYKDAEAHDSGPIAIASWQLLVHNDPTVGEWSGKPLTVDGAAELFLALSEFLEDQVIALRERLEGLAETDVLHARIAELASIDDSPDGRMSLRYEGQHDRSFRATLNQLIKLIQTGVDLVPEPEVLVANEVPAEPVVMPIKANEAVAVPAEMPIKAKPMRSRDKKQPRRGRNRRSDEAGSVREQPQDVI